MWYSDTSTSTGNSQELKSKKTEPIGCSGQSGRVYWKLGTVNLLPPFQAHSLIRLSFLLLNIYLDFWFQISETKRRTLEYPQPRIGSALGKRSTSTADVDWFICQGGS